MNQDGVMGGLSNLLRFVLRTTDMPRELCGNVVTEVHNKILGKNQTIASKNALIWPTRLEGTLNVDAGA